VKGLFFIAISVARYERKVVAANAHSPSRLAIPRDYLLAAMTLGSALVRQRTGGFDRIADGRRHFEDRRKAGLLQLAATEAIKRCGDRISGQSGLG
jgi:hypothetical protein